MTNGRGVTSEPAWLLGAAAPVIVLGLVNATYKEWLYASSPLLYWTADAVHFVVLPLAALCLLRLRCGVKAADIGFVLPRSREAAFGLASVSVLVLGAYALSFHVTEKLALGALGPGAPVGDDALELPAALLPRGALVAYLSLTAAFVEEGVYRGLLWRWVRARVPGARAAPVYIIGSAFLFAWIHSEQGLHVVAATFVLGLVACSFYLRIGNLWPLVAAHFAMDAYAFW